ACCNTKKPHDRGNTGKRKASSSQISKTSKRRGVADDQSGGASAPQPSEPPTKTTTRGRKIRLPSKYK
ncbi:hypothetical protein COCVIDRAFT_116661, partial [Bipolaris victoriae FI3]